MKYPSDSHHRLGRHTRAMRRALEVKDRILAERHLTRLIGEWALHLGWDEFYDSMKWPMPEYRNQLRNLIRTGLATIASHWPTMLPQDTERAVKWLASALEKECLVDRLSEKAPLLPLDFSTADGSASGGPFF